MLATDLLGREPALISPQCLAALQPFLPLEDNVAKPEGLALVGGEVERLTGSAATRVTRNRGFGLEEGLSRALPEEG